MSPFDIINTVCTTSDCSWDTIDEKEYNSFIINRGISMFHDTVLLAAEVAIRHTCPPKWQFDFYKHAITPKKKRFAKWAKPEKDTIIDLIMETYQVTRRKAISISLLFDENSEKMLKEMTFRGGK